MDIGEDSNVDPWYRSDLDVFKGYPATVGSETDYHQDQRCNRTTPIPFGVVVPGMLSLVVRTSESAAFRSRHWLYWSCDQPRGSMLPPNASVGTLYSTCQLPKLSAEHSVNRVVQLIHLSNCDFTVCVDGRPGVNAGCVISLPYGIRWLGHLTFTQILCR